MRPLTHLPSKNSGARQLGPDSERALPGLPPKIYEVMSAAATGAAAASEPMCGRMLRSSGGRAAIGAKSFVVTKALQGRPTLQLKARAVFSCALAECQTAHLHGGEPYVQ